MLLCRGENREIVWTWALYSLAASSKCLSSLRIRIYRDRPFLEMNSPVFLEWSQDVALRVGLSVLSMFSLIKPTSVPEINCLFTFPSKNHLPSKPLGMAFCTLTGATTSRSAAEPVHAQTPPQRRKRTTAPTPSIPHLLPPPPNPHLHPRNPHLPNPNPATNPPSPKIPLRQRQRRHRRRRNHSTHLLALHRHEPRPHRPNRLSTADTCNLRLGRRAL